MCLPPLVGRCMPPETPLPQFLRPTGQHPLTSTAPVDRPCELLAAHLAASYHYSTTPQYQFDHPMDNSENKLSPFYSDKLYSTSLHTSISQLSASILQLLSIKLISYPITLYSQQQDSSSHRSPSLCLLPYNFI